MEKLPPIPEPTDKESYSSFRGRANSGGAADNRAKKESVANIAETITTGPKIINLLGAPTATDSPAAGIINLFDTTTPATGGSGTAGNFPYW